MAKKAVVYSVGTLRWHKGHEGEPCAEATLLADGKKIADYADDEHGGCARWNVIDHKAFDAFQKLAIKNHPDLSFEQADMEMTEMVSIEHDVRKMRIDVNRGRTLFSLPADIGLGYRTVNAPISPDVVAYLTAKYGTAIVIAHPDRLVEFAKTIAPKF